ncbi:unnamed protein product [Rotaria sordida]|uniref:Tyrosine-protein kinase n=1 Tax=Rotaria sordida TaxID=392033 RepID=A0A818LNG2_9BILA|nr:unnamed protein product [Rotaria sordida]CAF0916681.1 unnamed protein product [Rotaria sordida]CAF1051479.1 unnamed protein product [Rotaria sordida]CAF3544815.1 unnamed protein product [Rotaria sordida]CAF3571405.1 unnamed protein product [Rotaria sordida]
MNSSSFNSNEQEQSVTNLVKIHSLSQLLKRDREQLLTQSRSIAYYHPNIDRDKAELLLRAKYTRYKRDGLFLLRDCTTSPHDFSLSIVCGDKCYHYKIQLIYDIYFSIDSGPQIAGIESLINYYQQRADGLACILSSDFVQGQPPPTAARRLGSTNTLHRACKQGNFEIVKKILSPEILINRPDVNGKDAFGSTALHEASYFGHDDIVRLLIKAGAHVLARDTDGATALHKAAASNRPSTLLILITEGFADYEERNYTNHWVPLHEAAFHNSTACVQVLLDCGAPLRPRTDQGKTPLELAEEVKSDESISLLREYKISPAESNRIDWLHNETTFDRLAAKQLIESIKTGQRNGMFVVRHSSKNLQNYALTIYNDNEFFNYEIIHLNDTTYYIDDGPYFDTLEHLIDHYCRIPDGLPTTLTCSINSIGQIINSRIQPFSLSSAINKTKNNLIKSKQNSNRQTNNEDGKTTRKKSPSINLNRRSTFSSTLSGSVTSLNSLSSRSRASSTHEDPLSTSSSSASLSSNSPSQHQATSLLNDRNPITNTTPFVDRRKNVGGKIKPFIPDFNNDNERRSTKISNGKNSTSIKRSTIPVLQVQKRKSLHLTIISPSQIQQTAKLGEGEFGEVYEGFYREDLNNPTGIPVAIKILKDYSYSAKKDFLREAEHMATLNHHCICTLYGIVDSSDDSMMMVIELLLLGSMLDYLWKHKNSIGENRLKLWASQIADGMAYMERKGIVHRDLAARNILMQSTDQVKISDFGLSRRIDADVYMQKSDSKIPVKWYAPEAISIGKFTTKSDVWSFGVTLWEMFSYAATPYGDMSGTDVYYFLQHGKRLERPSRCPSSTYQLMQKCWEWDEKKRPTFSELLQLLKNDSDYRDTNKTIPITTTLLRKKPLKLTLSSSTLVDENNDHNDEQKNEQYKINGNGNGHVSRTITQFQQALNKERTNS